MLSAPATDRKASRAALLVGASIALGLTVYLLAQWARLGLEPPLAATRARASLPAPDHRASLLAVRLLLAQYPPTLVLPPERRGALATLDSIFRDENASEQTAVQSFFHSQIEQAILEMRETTVNAGATVWSVYNHGFVVRTASATLCFDLVRAKYLPDFALSERLMGAIVEQCDVVFVSHAHADHAERFVAQTAIELGKPVVAPTQVGYREPLYGKVTHLERLANVVQTVPLKAKHSALSVVIYPGHQGEDIENNVVLVTTPDGITIAHTGDQWEKHADFEWIDHVAERFHVDILLPNDWTYDIARMVRGFNPELVIPGHANELGHSLDKRQSYAFSFERKIGSSRFGGNEDVGYAPPLVVMTWGESFHYEPRPDMERLHMRSVGGGTTQHGDSLELLKVVFREDFIGKISRSHVLILHYRP